MQPSHHKRFTLPVLLTLPWILIARPAVSQILPDDTLAENERSVVRSIDAITDRIEQGAVRGENLFHSFQEFNIDEGRRAYFANPDGIRNILSRVTGDDVSDILGTLGVDGNANLFFLNPNGIVFGENARLDVAGSFVASTGDRFDFPDGRSFNATEPNAPPLLTVNITPGLQMGAGIAPIVNDGQLIAGQDLTLHGSLLDLEGQLASGRELLLRGDSVQIRDSVAAPFIAQSGGALTIEGNTIDIFALNHPDSGLVSGGDMVLRSSTPVGGDAHYWSGGNFRIEQLDGTLGNLTSPNDPVIRAVGDVTFLGYAGASLHIFAGGSVTIPAGIVITGADPTNGLVEAVTLSDNSTVININGREDPTVDIRAGTLAVSPLGLVGNDSGFLFGVPSTGGEATSADITISGIVSGGGTVFLTNQYQPNRDLGGNIQIGLIAVDGGQIFIDSREDISLLADGSIDATSRSSNELGRVRLIAADEFFLGPNSKILNLTEGNNVGFEDVEFGAIEIVAGTLLLEELAEIRTSTASNRDGGDININVQGAVTLQGDRDAAPDDNGNLSNTFISSTILPGAQANSGDINISAGSLDIIGGTIIGTFVRESDGILPAGQGNAGDINIDVQGDMVIDGRNTPANTGIDANVDSGAVGQGGTITIRARNLSLYDAGFPSIRTDLLGTGSAGNIEINIEDSFILDGDSVIATTLRQGGTGRAGDLKIETRRLILRDGAQILTPTDGDGPAGTLSIDALERVEISGVASNGRPSGLFTLTRGSGVGGDLTINTGQLIVSDGGVLSSVTTADSTGRAGDITVTASDSILIRGEDSSVVALTSGEGNAGNIILTARDLTIADEAEIRVSSFAAGNSGDIVIEVSEDMNIDNSRLVAGREPGAEETAEGGDITIRGESITLSRFSLLNTASFGPGDAGDISLQTTQGNITLNDSSIFSLTLVDGDAGSISLQSAGAVIINGNSNVNSTVALGALGEGGDILIGSEDGLFITGIGARAENPVFGTDPKIDEIEPNSVLENAQAIDEFFSLARNPDVLFSNEIPYVAIVGERESSVSGSPDYYSFEVDVVGTQVTFDIDNVIPNDPRQILDAVLRLYDDQGEELASNNNAPIALGASGSNSSNDSYLTYIFNEPGTYFIQVEMFPDINNIDRGGTYNLNISRVDDFIVNSGITTQTRSSGSSGDITINTPIIDIENGGVISAETLSDGLAGNITLQPFDDGQRLSINLRGEGSQITGSTIADGNSGNLAIAAPEAITLRGDSRIAVETLGDGSGGTITINTGRLSIQDGFTVSARSGANDADNTDIRGDAGNILVETTESVTLSEGSQISVETNTRGQAGRVRVTTPILTVARDASITATATATASQRSQGGNIFLNASTMDLSGRVGVFSETLGQASAGNLILQPFQGDPNLDITLRNRARVSASTRAEGQGGNLRISAPNSILIQGIGENPGRIAVETTGAGDAGTLNIETNTLRIQDGVVISARSGRRSSATGRGGEIDIDANSLTLRDEAQITTRSFGNSLAGDVTIDARNVSLSNQASITAETENGPGGDIRLTGLSTAQLDNSQISAETRRGEAGQLRIVASDSISLVNNSTLSVEARRAAGRAGNLRLRTSELAVNDSDIRVSNPNGQAGNININANRIVLDTGTITAETGGDTSNGEELANITLSGLELFLLQNSSLVSAEANDQANGGNIDINAENGFVIADLAENSDIIATAIGGDGGNIDISVLRIFGLQERSGTRDELRSNTTNDISASSQFGTDGIIAIEDLGVDPVQAAAELPTDTGSPPLSQGCAPGIDGSGTFNNVGSGGIPAGPSDPIGSSSLWEDIEPAHQQPESEGDQDSSSSSNLLVEAEGWHRNANGHVVLHTASTSDSVVLSCQLQ